MEDDRANRGFETQNNMDKAVMHLNTTKLATLTDLVPTPSGTKSQEISKYLFEQPSYNKEWFNILFDSKSMARKEKLKREYLEKVEKGRNLHRRDITCKSTQLECL